MAKDPYQYFRIEARELLEGLSQGIVELEKAGVRTETVSRLLRLAHTLKGAARIVKQKEIAECAHSIEDLLTPLREAGGPLSAEQATRLLKLVDACEERLQAVQTPTPTVQAPAPREAEDAFTSVRVEIAELDNLVYELADLGGRVEAMTDETAALAAMEEAADRLVVELASSSASKGARARAEELRGLLRQQGRNLRAGLERVRHDVGAIRAAASDLRLLPARTIFPVLERTARDAAEALKKRVAFESAGGDYRLDAHVLLALRDALAHVIRNAVAHGIEVEARRVAVRKPPEGRVRLRVEKNGQRVHFQVADDGAGVNLAAIQDALIARRIVPLAQARALGLDEAIQLLLQGGLSTAPEVSEVMGRGIGLDVVRATAVRLKGDVHLSSKAGQGARVEIIVPVSLEALDVLAVDAGQARVLIPFDAIRRTVRLASSDLARSATATTLILDGQALPFRPLAEILGGKRVAARTPPHWTALIVQARGEQAALGVDRLDGVRHVVVRPLPALCGSIPLVAGAALDSAGNPELLLDPARLVAAVRSENAAPIVEAARVPAAVLVVDDSLTTRILEQSILETAGYQVDLATSGEEALQMARRKPYAIFIVDVEMPGMNGFELLEQFRLDPRLQTTPAILVTSRSSDEDRRRGEEAGARAHIAKSDFAQGDLLSTIAILLGEERS